MSNEMFRTVRAALTSALLGIVLIGGFGLLLGFPMKASLIAGGIAALFFALLVGGAAMRSGHLQPPPGAETES